MKTRGTILFTFFIAFILADCNKNTHQTFSSYEEAQKTKIKQMKIRKVEINRYYFNQAARYESTGTIVVHKPSMKFIKEYDINGNIIKELNYQERPSEDSLVLSGVYSYEYNNKGLLINGLDTIAGSVSNTKYIYSSSGQLMNEIFLLKWDTLFKVRTFNIYECDNVGRLNKETIYGHPQIYEINYDLIILKNQFNYTYDDSNKIKIRHWIYPKHYTDSMLVFQPDRNGYIERSYDGSYRKYDSLPNLIESKESGWTFKYENRLDEKGNLLEQIVFRMGIKFYVNKYHYEYY